MPWYTPTHTFVAGETLTAANMNAASNDMATLLNVTKLNSTNIQAGGLSLSNMARPYSVHTIQLQCAEGGTGTGRALADFDLYATVLDQIMMCGDGWLIGMSVVGATGFCDPAQRVQLYKYVGGVESALPGTILTPVAAAAASVPTDAALNVQYSAGDTIRVRMTGAATLANLPVLVTVWCKEYHRS